MITRKTVKSGGKAYVYYICSANKANRNICSKHSIRQTDLDEAVLAAIQAQINVILDLDKALQQIKSLAWERSEIKKIEANIDAQNQIIHKNRDLRMGIYEDLREGIISQDEFQELKQEFTQRIADAKRAVEKLNAAKNEILQGSSMQQGWLAQFRKYQNITEITRPVIVNLIEKIYVYENNEIQVVFRHRDQLADIMSFLKNQNTVEKKPETTGFLRQEVI